jgi:ABC-type branched-subunit amino acid transport system substrate-binding protein
VTDPPTGAPAAVTRYGGGRRALVAMLLCCLAACAGCSLAVPPTDAAGAGRSLTTLPAAPPPPGGPVTVLTWGPLTGTAQMPDPDLAVVARAFADTANADGGVNGRVLSVVTCDDRGEAAGELECARRAVAMGVSAVVGAIGVHPEQALPVLRAAGIPYLGPVAPAAEDFTDPIAFPITGGTAVQVTGAAVTAAGQGCRRVGLLVGSGAAAASLAGFARAGLAGSPAVLTGTGIAPAGLGSVDPAVDAAATGSDCLLLATGAQTTERVLGTLDRRPARPRLFTIGAGYSREVAAQYPDLAGSVLSCDSFPPVSDPAWQPYRDALARVPGGASVQTDGEVARGAWAAFEVFLQVGRRLVSFDAAALLAALRSADPVDTGGLLAPLDLAHDVAAPGMSRLSNPSVTVLRYAGGDLVPAVPGFLHLDAQLSARR